jgi:hypothetical protein
MYAIIQNARKGEFFGVKKLALVDRGVTKALWWTSDNPSIVIKYLDKRAAEFAAKRLKRNNAVVVHFSVAENMLMRQRESIYDAQKDIDHMAAMDSLEDGWDGHKNSF